MKKILVSLFIAIFSFSSIFANYKPTEADKQMVISLEKAVEKLPTEKINILKERIPTVLEKLDKNSRNYFLISEIEKIINKKTSENILDVLLIGTDYKDKKEEIKENIEELYEVVEVIDGDSIHFMKGNKKVKARLIGIDAPESTTSRYGYVEENGKEATEKLKELIGNNKISVEYDETQDKTDKYGRDLIYIFVNGKNLNEEMVKSGFAKEYTYKTKYKYQKEFRQAERDAIIMGIGIWKTKEIPKIENKSENKKSYNSNNSYSSGSSIKSDYRTYYTGKRGGCYYYSGSGKKVYVSRSFCR